MLKRGSDDSALNLVGWTPELEILLEKWTATVFRLSAEPMPMSGDGIGMTAALLVLCEQVDEAKASWA